MVGDIRKADSQALLDGVIGYLATEGRAWARLGSSLAALLPCALIVTGYSYADQDVLFDHLRRRISGELGACLVVLSSDDCQSYQSTLRCVCAQIAAFMGPSASPAGHHWDALLARFRHLHSRSASPPPVVLFMTDIEQFPPHTLPSLVSLCHASARHVQFSFVLGMATKHDALFNLLPYRLSSLLSVSRFRSQAPRLQLDQLVYRLLIKNTQPYFRLGADVYRFLLSEFDENHLSLDAWIKHFRYCVMEHFSLSPAMSRFRTEQVAPPRSIASTTIITRPLSSFSPSFSPSFSSSFSSSLMNLPSEVLCELRELPSITEFLKTRSLTDRSIRRRFQDDDHFRTFVQQAVDDLRLYIETFGDAFDCYYRLLTELGPQAPLRIDAYANLYSPAHDNYATLSMAIMRLDGRALETLIRDWMSLLRVACPSFDAFREGLRTITEASGISPSASLEWVGNLANRHLQSPQKFPLHEVFFFTDPRPLIDSFKPSPADATLRALDHPREFLRCPCCPQRSIAASSPDISIAFVYYRQARTHLNLENWFQSFQSISRQPTGAQEPASVLRARFSFALDELKLLGFIKDDPKKPDVVQKAVPLIRMLRTRPK